MERMKKVILIFVLSSFFIILSGSEDFLQELGATYWWNDSVFYEIFVRSFYDSDGDGIGDIKGLIEKLDYLNDGDPQTITDLGITGIWLMPICQSPSYHGYDVTDYKTIEEDYGTNKDFQLFMKECHKRGIKVIVDFVMNHCSSQHPWFQQAKENKSYYRNWFRWKSSKPSYLGPWGQPVWHESGNEYYFGLFWGGMPDLNYKSKAVRKEMFSLTKYWLEEMKVDGFRCDAVKHIFEEKKIMQNVPETFEWWREFHNYYKKIKPEALTVGEAWDSSDIVIQYLDRRFDFCFEFDLATSVLYAINNSSAIELKQKIQEIIEIYPYHQYGTFLTNHDQDRVMDQLAFSLEKAKFAASIYLTLPGIPFIYYGEEIGMNGAKPDPNIRRPMQWTASENAGFSESDPWQKLNANFTEFNVEEEQEDANSLWYVYRNMISLRQKHPALRRGTIQILESSNEDIFAILRKYEDDIVLLIYNFGSNQKEITLSFKRSNLQTGSYELTGIIPGQKPISMITNEVGGCDNAGFPGLNKYQWSIYLINNSSTEE